MLKYSLYFTTLMLAITSIPASSAGTSTTTNEDELVVQINNGKVRGRRDSTVGLNKNYIAFQGIPFAQPPVGNLRFEPPVPPKNWNGTLNVTKYKGDCVQGADGALGGAPEGSEDCLYINVYKPNVTSNKLAVMVWIYGGAFFFGTSGPELYGPDYLLDNDVIVVTFNYRLGIFGFLSTGDLVVPGNNGLKDQTLALKWVKENIAQFGGDPNKITLFGESAGGASITYHLIANESSVAYRNVIMESGSALCIWSLSRQMKEAVSLVAQNFNLSTNNSQALVDALKQINATTLHIASDNVRNILQGDFRKGFVFAPVIEPLHSDAFLTQKPHQLLTQGKFKKVPVLSGINSMEDLYFSDTVETYYLNSSIERFDLVPIDLNLRTKAETDLVYNIIKSYYFGTKPVWNQTYQVFQFASNDLFDKPVIETNRLLSKQVKTYFYEFEYVGNLSENSNNPVPGVSHFDEIFYIFRKDSNATTATDKLVRSRMTRMWTNFAKYSNPTPTDEDLLENINWPPADTIKNNLLYLEINSDLKLGLNPKNYYQKFWNKIYTTFGNPPFDTY